MNWQNLRNWISNLKHKFNRGYGYVGALGIGFVVAQSVQSALANIGVSIPIYVLYPAGVIGLLVIGYIDERYGFQSKEMEVSTRQNTFLLEKLEEIKQEVRELKNEQ